MISTIIVYCLFLLSIAALIWYAKTRDYNDNSIPFGIILSCILVFGIVVAVQNVRVCTANINVDAQYEELQQKYIDLQKQVDAYTDERALESVMQRVEEYNQKVAYGKEACHSAWNYLLYPARIYDNLKFVMMPEG